MKLVILASFISLSFSSIVLADGVCAATEFGYEAFCEAQPNESACNFHDQCAWAIAGYGSCSAREFGYEAFCEAQPSESACNFHEQCFWTDPR